MTSQVNVLTLTNKNLPNAQILSILSKSREESGVGAGIEVR